MGPSQSKTTYSGFYHPSNENNENSSVEMSQEREEVKVRVCNINGVGLMSNPLDSKLKKKKK